MTSRQLSVQRVYKKKSKSPISSQIKTPRNRTSNDALREEEIRKLISGCEDLLDRTLLILGFNTGMRVSEITNIDVSLIDWNNGHITVHDFKKKKFRKVYPGERALAAIKLYIQERKVRGPALFDISEKTTERHFQTLTERILNDKRSWHTVRHSYVTMCARKKIDIKVTSMQTGDSIATLQKVYNNPSPEDMRSNTLELG